MDAASVRFVDEIPRLYDQHLGPVIFEPYARDMARRVAAVRPRRVLEVACGTGIVTRALRNALAADCQLVATDLNQPMIDYARSKPYAGDIEWRQADGTQLPFPDGSVDAVVCQFGYMFFPDKPAAFREAARVLAPAGRLFFSVWNGLDQNPSGLSAQEAVHAHVPVDPPMFYRVPFGYHDEQTIRRDLAAAGLHDVAFDNLVVDADMPSPASVATGLVRGTPMFVTLAERGADIDAIEQDVARRLSANGGPSAHTLRLDASIVTAGLR